VDGGYDSGYAQCPCFWGREPGSLVRGLVQLLGDSVHSMKALDVGCGEGKNAVYLAQHGADVVGVDVSRRALQNATNAWAPAERIHLLLGDAMSLPLRTTARFDIVIAYGLLHCLPTGDRLATVVSELQHLTSACGYNVIATFNDRSQDLSAHPGLAPCLMSHASYVQLYAGWEIISATDTDLHEIHPHNMIPHHHSLTRILARRRE
jgi:tellurite methyltransferase